MNKSQLEIVGLSYSQTQSGAYALVLGEVGGSRRLPIIIGGFEAQAIAIELEKMTPSRPLTHDLFKSFAEVFEIEVSEVLIYNLVEGIFYAKLLCKAGEKEVEIDARTSDAIALAIRFKCPIYTYEFILKNAGIVLDDEGSLSATESESTEKPDTSLDTPEDPYDIKLKSTEELKSLLKSAIEQENYETASKIRDEINNRKKS
jgi:bifunctional DNase/RNase